MHFAGIDLSDRWFDVCLLAPQGQLLGHTRLDFTEEGFAHLIHWLSERQSDTTPPNDKPLISLENPRSRLVDYLRVRGFTLYAPNPKAIARYRDARFASKSDPTDAHLLADHLREHHAHWTPLAPLDPRVRSLCLMLEDRDKLVKERTRLKNQLIQTLKESFPEALDALRDVTSATGRRFLNTVDTLAQMQQQPKHHWEQFLDGCRCYAPQARQRFLQLYHATPSHIPDEVVASKGYYRQALLGQFASIQASLASYDAQIQVQLDALEKAHRPTLQDASGEQALFLSLPGAGVLLAAKLTVLFEVRAFESVAQARAFCGTCPTTEASGRGRTVRFRTGCCKRARQTLQQFAFCSLTRSAFARAYYQKKRREGKSAQHAMRCLANVWLKILFAMWRDQTVYDESKHLQAVALQSLATNEA